MTTVAEAELLIMHGGAGSIIHSLQMGKVPVVMPRLSKYGEIIDDHQLEFVLALAESGRIVLAREPSDLAQAVSKALSRQRSAGSFSAMSPMIDMVRTALQTHATHLKPPFPLPAQNKS